MLYLRRLFHCGGQNRGQKLNPNIFFSNFSGASGISRQNPGISRQESLIPWVSRDIPNFLAPTPSRGRPPPHQKISGLKSLGLGSFFVPDRSATTHKRIKDVASDTCLGCNCCPSTGAGFRVMQVNRCKPSQPRLL